MTDPERKRKIIGGLLWDVFKAEAEKLKAAGNGVKGLPSKAQGTIYPDVVVWRHQDQEGHHHQEPPQRGGLPEQLGLKLLEPLRELFRTKCVSWAWHWGCLPIWSTATHSPALAWGPHSG